LTALVATADRIFVSNGHNDSITVIDAKTQQVIATVALPGRPEFPVADGKGSVFVNIEDTSQIAHLNAKTHAIEAVWPLAPCEGPSGLAIDKKDDRLFSVCDGKKMAVVDAKSGKVVATPAIGAGVDANAFDPETKLAFSSNGQAGTLTVVHEDEPDKFNVVENVPTKKSARTMGLDLKTHNIFLPAADFDPPAEGERRPKMKPGSMVIVVAGK